MTTASRGRPTKGLGAAGPKGQVVSLVLRGGASPAFEFLAQLDDQAQAAFRARIDRLTTVGYLRSPDDWRRLEIDGDPTVNEIKVHKGPGYRLYVIREAPELWVATHGRRKPKDRAVPAEVARARSYYGEWMS